MEYNRGEPGGVRYIFQAGLMAFPETRHTLIRRIVIGGDDTAWSEFLADYWGPICRFARYRGNLSLQDAEDVASQVFEACLKNHLLVRWADTPAAKLRTLICTVVRNVLSNRARVQSGRERLQAEIVNERAALGLNTSDDEAPQQDNIFYAAWVDDLLQSAVEALLLEYHQSGRSDYFRVLYGRICEEMAVAEVADLLQLKPTTVENYYRSARQRLGDKLQEIVGDHVQRYSAAENQAHDFEAEWRDLGEFLKAHGGLETAVRRAYDDFDPASRQTWRAKLADGTLRGP